MEQTENSYCVILAGGKGRRLWPYSRKRYPKQFIDFFGVGRTQLQQTYDRMVRIFPKENIFINTNRDYVEIVRQQLPELPESHIIGEPIHRNTIPSAVWTLHRIRHFGNSNNATVMFTPADHVIHNDDLYREEILEGLNFVANNDYIMNLAVKPTRAEPGYGYIQLGDPMEHNIYKVQSFTEKPEREFAKMFMESGEFYWNTGLFLANVNGLWSYLCTLLPNELRQFDKEHPNWTIEEEEEFMNDHFPIYPNLPLDLTILEKCEKVCVMKCDFGWADVGTWHSIYEAMRKSENDNVIIDSDVLIDEAKNNVVKLPKGKLAVINGLEGYIVVENDNVLLICKKEDSSALVRKYVNEVQMKKGEKYI
ncbi:MAG: mannose-1-phosphate guanylyltransferase [Prevotella sp.]|jgi:mannose-1-phosphate guanylyltransferase